ncbi:MAG: hypothetical protein HUK21_04045, partial [Fibrobacteraceae bacterium]|nr:hypothetical protein [Fibrobacteraceae bacterium]
MVKYIFKKLVDGAGVIMKNPVPFYFLPILTSLAFTAPPANFSGWEMVFEDEFEGTSLDKSKWNPTYNWGHTHNH